MRLRVRRVEPEDIGAYRCVSSNSLGTSEASVRLIHIRAPDGRRRGQLGTARSVAPPPGPPEEVPAALPSTGTSNILQWTSVVVGVGVVVGWR